jgi:hypothetical protein
MFDFDQQHESVALCSTATAATLRLTKELA